MPGKPPSSSRAPKPTPESEQPPTLTPIRSSHLSGAGYIASSRTLYIRFANGSLYRYDDVQDSVWRGLMAAPSAGTFHSKHILDRLPFTKL